MLATWKTSYFGLLHSTKLMSQLATFILFMVAVLTLIENIYETLRFGDWEFIQSISENILVGVGFQSLIALTLLSRFIALQTGRYILSMLLWVSVLSTTYLYIAATRRSFFVDPNYLGSRCMDCFYYDTFSFSSVTFTVIFLCYPFVSIFKELALITVATINSYKRKPL